jgi:hypothetical protein
MPQPPVGVWRIVDFDDEQRVWAFAIETSPRPRSVVVRFAPDGKSWDRLLDKVPGDHGALTPDRRILAIT